MLGRKANINTGLSDTKNKKRMMWAILHKNFDSLD